MIMRGQLSLPREVLFQNQNKAKGKERAHMGTDDRQASGPDTKLEARASLLPGKCSTNQYKLQSFWIKFICPVGSK